MRIDATSPVPLVLYGVPFHNLTFEEAVDWIVARVRSGRPASIATANLDFVTRAWKDPELQRVLIDADLVLADGFPIVKLSPFYGPAIKERVTGSDLTPLLAERAAREGLSVFGLGGADGVAAKALDVLKQRHPDLKIAGSHAPKYQPLLEMDHRDMLRRLDAARPDLLFVAFGAPKQDKFIHMHVRGWSVPVAIGIGASLDFIAGEQIRAPRWMRKAQLEWFWRVGRSPRRLFTRYCGNLCFLISASRRMMAVHRMPDRPVAFQAIEDADAERLAADVWIERFQPLDSERAARAFIERVSEETGDRNALIDAHAAPWLNSLELGAVLEINKRLRARGKRLILYAPRPKVSRLLETCRLTDYFDTATRLEEVEAITKNLAEHARGASGYEGGALILELPMELTAATLPDFERAAEFIHHELRDKGALKTVKIDAAQLDFIDSSGLGFLIALKKKTRDEGVSMSIANLPSKPRRTFEIARVDKVLLHA